MAELINKGKLVEAMALSHTAHANNSREESLLNGDLRIVMEQSTTTESEIRAKAVKDFVEWLDREYDTKMYIMNLLVIWIFVIFTKNISQNS